MMPKSNNHFGWHQTKLKEQISKATLLENFQIIYVKLTHCLTIPVAIFAKKNFYLKHFFIENLIFKQFDLYLNDIFPTRWLSDVIRETNSSNFQHAWYFIHCINATG